MAFTFNVEENKDKIDELCNFIDEKKDVPGALMPVLQKAQTIFGYLPEEILKLIAKKMNIFPAKVFGVATFYSQFSFIPKGKYQVAVCMGTACYVKGAQEILDEFCNRIGIDVGGTSEDLKFSVFQTRCIGECNLAPVVTINEDVYAYIKKADIRRIMRKYK